MHALNCRNALRGGPRVRTIHLLTQLYKFITCPLLSAALECPEIQFNSIRFVLVDTQTADLCSMGRGTWYVLWACLDLPTSNRMILISAMPPDEWMMMIFWFKWWTINWPNLFMVWWGDHPTTYLSIYLPDSLTVYLLAKYVIAFVINAWVTLSSSGSGQQRQSSGGLCYSRNQIIRGSDLCLWD